jgi:RNA polymerase sigma-70 factor, ECF subfamily
MQITADSSCRRIAVGSLARPTIEKRRSLGWEARSTKRTSQKAAPSVSSIPNPELSEAEAVQRARNGDQTVFESLYRLHSRRVYALCLRMVKDTAEAEDLTQETFLLVFRKLHTFRGESAFSTWLHRLTVNLVLMRLRKKSLPLVSIEAATNPDDQKASPNISALGAPDLMLKGALERIMLERCIEDLPAGFRKVLVLHDIRGYRHREIANLLGRSIGASKSQLHKARKRLRESFQELRSDKAHKKRLAAVRSVSSESVFACETSAQH